MRNFVAVVFSSSDKAYDGLHELWTLDGEGSVTVHGTAVVHRDWLGHMVVDTKETYPALATAVGAGVGALLGALAGPVGAAASAAAGAAAAGAGAGALLGGAAGLIADADRADVREEAGAATAFVLKSGQHAVIADVSEDWTTPINERMKKLGGTVYRRSREEIEDNAWSRSYYPYDLYLYPYEYRPIYPRYPLD
jgi:uncharacterized membrane protein